MSSVPSWRRRKQIVGDLTPEDIERGTLLATIILALTGSFTPQDRAKGSVIDLRTGINKINRRTVRGNKKLAKKLASMSIQAWHKALDDDPTIREYSTALLMSVVWHKYRPLLCKMYGEHLEKHIDTIMNKLHDINCPEYAAVEVSTYKVAENIVKSINKTIYDRKDG